MSLIRKTAEKQINMFSCIDAMWWGERHYRFIRRIIGEFSRKGKILIPVGGDRFYKDVELLPIELVEKYAQSQINHIKNQYQNKVRPLRKYINDEQLKSLMGTLESAMDVEE